MTRLDQSESRKFFLARNSRTGHRRANPRQPPGKSSEHRRNNVGRSSETPRKSSFFPRKSSGTPRNSFGSLLGKSSTSLVKKKEIKPRLELGTSGVPSQRSLHWTTAPHTLQDMQIWLLILPEGSRSTALPLSLYGSLTSFGSYKKSYTSITSPLASGTVGWQLEDNWRLAVGESWCAFGVSWCLSIGDWQIGVYLTFRVQVVWLRWVFIEWIITDR